MKILIKGAGDLATGIAYELWLGGYSIMMTEIETPMAVRRMVSFCRAVYEGEAWVEEAKGVLVSGLREAYCQQEAGNIPVMVDAKAGIRTSYCPDVLVDTIMAKKNLGTSITDAPLVIGIGPGFCAGEDCHYVIETQRGPHLGEVIKKGYAIPNTGIPGDVAGYTIERLIKAPADGLVEPLVQIGDVVQKGQPVAKIGEAFACAGMTGIVRGMIKEGTRVSTGLKIGDIDGRIVPENCYRISDKARKIGQSVRTIVTVFDTEEG